MGYWYHPGIEERTVGVFTNYHYDHPDANFRLEFDNGETYICTYLTSYESGNWSELAELEIDEGDPRYDELLDEFYEIGFLVTTVVKGGRRQPGPRQYLAISYRDFPSRIIDADTGQIIYPAV